MKHLLPALCLVAACGGGGDNSDGDEVDSDDLTTPDAALGTVEPLLGTFTASLNEATADASAYSSLVGKVYDGKYPDGTIWDTAMTVGDCKLLKPRVPFCDPACGGSVCTDTNTCTAYPSAHELGTITATGFASDAGASFQMTAIANGYQPPATVHLSATGFTEGEKLELVTTGSDFTPAFTVGTRGVAALALTTSPVALAAHTSLALAWTPPSGATTSSIFVKLDISHHGGSKGKLECTTADDGAFAIDSTLVDALLDLGAAGYPTIILTRSHTGGQAITGGRVDFVAQSQVERAVTVPGLTSCTDNTECPDGQTCQSDLTCQ